MLPLINILPRVMLPLLHLMKSAEKIIHKEKIENIAKCAEQPQTELKPCNFESMLKG